MLLKFLFLALLMLISCTSSGSRSLDGRDSDLYNRVGYKPGYAPKAHGNRSSNAVVKVTPDYYYRTADKRRPARKAPKRSVRVKTLKYEPSSRYYNNPYSFKPPLNFPYFDADQYYVPPTGYNGRGHDSHHDESGQIDIKSGTRKDQLY